jgi:hypothetical protein
MAGNDPRFIRKRKQALAQRTKDLLRISTWQIRPANGSREERIAGKEQLLRGEV